MTRGDAFISHPDREINRSHRDQWNIVSLPIHPLPSLRWHIGQGVRRSPWVGSVGEKNSGECLEPLTFLKARGKTPGADRRCGEAAHMDAAGCSKGG